MGSDETYEVPFLTRPLNDSGKKKREFTRLAPYLSVCSTRSEGRGDNA